MYYSLLIFFFLRLRSKTLRPTTKPIHPLLLLRWRATSNCCQPRGIIRVARSAVSKKMGRAIKPCQQDQNATVFYHKLFLIYATRYNFSLRFLAPPTRIIGNTHNDRYAEQFIYSHSRQTATMNDVNVSQRSDCGTSGLIDRYVQYYSDCCLECQCTKKKKEIRGRLN